VNWLQRLRGKSEVLGAVAFNDIMSVLYPERGQAIVTDARSAVDKSVWIMRAVSTVSTRVGSLPWKLFKGDKAVEGMSGALTRPSPNQTGTEFIERIVAWQLLHGTGMVYVEKPAIKGITVLDADMVHIDQGGNIQYRDGKSDRQLDKSNIVLFPNFSLSGQLGLSELRPILDTANMDEGAKQVWNSQMSSGGALAGLMTTDFKLTGPELMAAKKAWEEKYSGIQKAGGIGWLSAGYHFEKLGISAADLKLLEVSKVTREEIGAAFGVPGVFLNDTQSVDYSNAQTQERILYSNTIIPKADRLADRITTFLLPLLPGLKGLTFRFDYTGIECLQANRLERAQSDEIEFRSGKLTINEARIRDGLKPVAWGSAWWASAMLVPIVSSEIIEPTYTPIVADDLPAETPPEPAAAPPQEPKGLKALHTPEARKLIAKAFISKVKPEEKKFAAETMKVFNSQAKLVTSWVEGGKSMIEPTREDCDALTKAMDLDESNMVEIALDEYKLKAFRYKAAIVKPIRRLLDDKDFVSNWHSLFVAFGRQAAEDVAARYSMIVPDGSAILKWIRSQESKHSKLVNDTTADEISKILADARANGQSIPEMVKATKGYFDNVAYRAERVARCNVIAVNNASAQDVYVENGVEKHEWLSTNDDRTRDDHVTADGQVVGINEPFSIGGESLMYPGDPAGSADETINCRCSILPVV